MRNNASSADISLRRTSHGQLKKMGRRCWTLRLLLLILGHNLLDINQAGSSAADKTIRIGYLMQKMPRAGAINVAIEQAQNDGFIR